MTWRQPETPVAKRHPFLAATPRQLETARARIAECEWAAKMRDRLIADARELESVQLPEFDLTWWREEGSKKHWTEIYPPIQEHTNYIPAPPIHKARSAAKAFGLTGESEIAAAVRRVLMHYTSYSFEYEHPDVGLNWSVWGIPALEAYDLISETLLDDDHAEIDDFFRRWQTAIYDHDQWWIEHNPGGMFNNHFAWHKLSIGSYGLFYGKEDLVDYALDSDQGFRELIENGMLDSGLWLEGSLNYHYTALEAIARMARFLRNAGHTLDLYNHEFANGRSLRQLFSGITETVFPDMSVPTAGDAYGRVIRLPEVDAYAHAWDAYRDPLYAWILSRREEPSLSWLFLEELPTEADPPPMTTQLFPEHGYAVLRTQEGDDYWRGDGFTAFVSFDRDGIHSHHDKFDLILFGQGKLLLPDAEALSSAKHSFSSKVQNELNHSTLCHNTLMVDGRDHRSIGEKLTLERFINLSELKLVSVSDLGGLVHPAVRMRRTLAATEDFVLDIFQATSNEQHTYDLLIHAIDDDGVTRVSGDFLPFEMPDSVPWVWLRNVRSRAEDRDWSAEWRQGDLLTRATLLGEQGTTVIACDFPRTDRFEPPAIPMVMVRRRCKSVLFVVCYQAGQGTIPAVRLEAAADRHGMIRVRVDVEGRRRDILVPAMLGGIGAAG